MLLVRALNEYDIVSDPINNGLVSKTMIYSLTKSHYDNSKDSEYLNLNDKEKDKYIKEHMKDYLVSHKHKLEKYYIRRNKLYRETMNALLNNHNPSAIIMFKKIMSSLQGHLNSGSRTETNWISTSKTIGAVKKYYDMQDTHGVALISSNTNGIIDSDRILTVDVSASDKIENNPYLYNKIDCNNIETLAYLSTEFPFILSDFDIDYVVPTNLKASGFNFSKSSKEVCVYEYIPSSHIIGMIEALQMDLIQIGAFSFDYYKLNKSEQLVQLNALKNTLLQFVRLQNEPYLLHVFEEIYLNNKNINGLVSFKDSKEKIVANRNKILRLAKSIPNIQIKR